MARKHKGCVHYLQYKRSRVSIRSEFGSWELVESYNPKRYKRMTSQLPWLLGETRKFPALSQYQIRRIEH